MKRDLLVFSSYQMIDNVRSRCVAPSIAEPLPAHIAHNNTRSFMYSTVFASMLGQVAMIVSLLFFLLELQLSEALAHTGNLQVQGGTPIGTIDLRSIK